MNRFFRMVSRVLIVSMLLTFHPAHAGIVGTDQLISATQVQGDREKVLNFISRTNVQQQLETLGVKPGAAQERVAAMTDEEVRTLAGQVDTLPAGGTHGWAIAAAVILIGAAVLYFVYK
ncbi:PA2779 family protein [Collimonas silvisoli]|uniref:PA2779 family protein n=1 Tax=Collimonas silvisoli TaxID=2825884 RepID=UPI001B8A93C1|nr:PA2779 family protein [Collimonas silvisoli]